MKPTAMNPNSDAASKPQLDQYIQKIVDAAPPLTAEQRDRLALLLRGAGASA